MLAKYPVVSDAIATNRPNPWRGLRVDYMSTISRRGFGRTPSKTLPGVIVTEVVEGSPAAAAGIKKGQSIRKVEKRAVRSPREFTRPSPR